MSRLILIRQDIVAGHAHARSLRCGGLGWTQGDDTCFDLVAILYPGCFILFMSGSIFVCVGQLIAFLAHRGLEERLLRHDAIVRKSSRNSPLYACVSLVDECLDLCFVPRHTVGCVCSYVRHLMH